jgi:hypothetical protein
VECLSVDGVTCLWGTPTTCQDSIDNAANLAIRPVKCSKTQVATGVGFCYNGAAALNLTTGKSGQSIGPVRLRGLSYHGRQGPDLGAEALPSF